MILLRQGSGRCLGSGHWGALLLLLLMVAGKVYGQSEEWVSWEQQFAQLEQGVAEEINRLRRDPQGYIATLRALKESYEGDRLQRPSGQWVRTREGVAAVDEAIIALAQQPPVPALARSRSLYRVARDHVDEQGISGDLGHTSRQRGEPHQRLRRYGQPRGGWGEAISYGPNDPVSVVTGLIVDDGVPDRSHRHTLLSERYRQMGVACGPHARLRVVCVITLVREWRPR